MTDRAARAAGRAPGASILAAGLLIGIGAAATLITSFGSALEYQRDLLRLEPWRALSGHLVHINGRHALLNLLAGGLILLLFRGVLTLRQVWLLVVIAALGVTFGLATLFPEIAWYRGFSGVLHGAYFAAATVQLARRMQQRERTVWQPALLLLAGALKIVLEHPLDADLRHADWLGAAVVPQAHLAGALVGVLFGSAIAPWRRPAMPR